MAIDPKKGKKVATKAAKVAGVHKVPKYAQAEVNATPIAPKPASKTTK